ncbi:uncharacterized protein [Clytia hemisphaerica]|uniref:uncharacterized protein n=1 Tax=Clytia hemisphaerica TaxID=252671 RepID=UPI0034D71C76
MGKIIELESVSNINDLKALRNLYDTVETQLRNLETFEMKNEEYGPLLIPLLMNKMPGEMQLIISRNISNEQKFDLSTLLKTFKNELVAREKISSSCLQESKFTGSSLLGHTQRSNRHDNASSKNLSTKTSERKQCIFCKRNHKEQYCDIVENKEIRKSIIIKERRCFCCFKIGHSSKQCRTNMKCFVCKGKHHVSICTNNEQDKNIETLTKEKEKDSSNKKEGNDESVSCVAGSKNNNVFLQTATATVSSKTKEQKMRILFDLGSQITYITPKAAERLELNEPIATKDICIKSFNDNSTNKTLNVFEVTVKGKNCEIPVTALCNEICHPLKNQNIESVYEIPEFASLDFADSNPKNSPLVVDMLIGADNYWRFFNDHKVKNSKGTLVAIDTKLGYVLSGSINKKSVRIKRFDHACSRVPYEILNDNFETSKRRLRSVLLKHFKSNEELLKTYDTIIKEQIELGVIEEVPTSSTPENAFYLPHRPVCRDDRITTKVRMVFDASSSTYGPSLNDCLNPGPSLTTSLFGILLRFRAKNIGLVADIEKAFWQIMLNEKDRDFVRFLWLKDINDIDFKNFDTNQLVTYRICRVLFGVTSSPFLLNGTLRHHINKIQDTSVRDLLLRSLHVDDLTTSLDTEAEACEFYTRESSPRQM